MCEGQDGVLCQPAVAAMMERPWGAQMSGSFPHSSCGYKSSALLSLKPLWQWLSSLLEDPSCARLCVLSSSLQDTVILC